MASLATATLDCASGASNGTIFASGGNTYDIVCNYQYGGADIGASKYTETFDACVGLCDTTTGCVDAIWSSAKYCYLKSSKTNGYNSPNWYTAVKRVPTPATLDCTNNKSNGTVWVTAHGSYDILCNYQFTGDTIGSKQAETFEACANLCDTTTGCVDVVWSSAKYCWLKSSKVTGYASPNWFTAVKRK